MWASLTVMSAIFTFCGINSDKKPLVLYRPETGSWTDGYASLILQLRVITVTLISRSYNP
jgi:hypothetical protein